MRGATLALGLLVLTGCAETRPVEPSRPNPTSGPRAVIVVPFDASSLPPNDQWIGDGVAQLVSLGLVQHSGVVQLERARVRAVSDPDVWTETIVRRTARELHADAALYGRVRQESDGFVIEPLLLSLRTGGVASLPTLTVSRTDFLQRVAPLPALYARQLQPTSDVVSARIERAARPTASLRAFELFTRGQMALYRGDAEAAVDPLLLAIEADSRQFVVAQYALGVAHVTLGNRWKAAAQFRASTQLDARMPEPYKALGDLFLAAPRSLVEYAIEAYDKALQLRPFYADAYVGVGNAQAARGDVDGALAAYQKALKYDPFNPVTHVKLGKIWADRGLCAESASAYKRARELDPRAVDVQAAAPCAKSRPTTP